MSGDQNYGPAFPTPYYKTSMSDAPDYLSGMSLRDWFAGQAMAVFIQNTQLNPRAAEIGAAAAYEWADAMLAERAPALPATPKAGETL